MNRWHQHLEESQMTYWRHLVHSVAQSARLFLIALKSLVHGILPNVYVNSGPLGVYKIYKEIKRLEHVRKLFKSSVQ